MNSPRTVEAMRVLGLDARELLPVSADSIKQYFIVRERKADIPKDLIDLRFKMLNERRFAKQRLIYDKRNELIKETGIEIGRVSRQSARFVS